MYDDVLDVHTWTLTSVDLFILERTTDLRRSGRYAGPHTSGTGDLTKAGVYMARLDHWRELNTGARLSSDAIKPHPVHDRLDGLRLDLRKKLVRLEHQISRTFPDHLRPETP